MQNESTSKERKLKIHLIKDINNIDVLMQLGEIYYYSGRLGLAKSCFSKILRISNDTYKIQKTSMLLLITERDIQVNQNKVESLCSRFLRYTYQ